MQLFRNIFGQEWIWSSNVIVLFHTFRYKCMKNPNFFTSGSFEFILISFAGLDKFVNFLLTIFLLELHTKYFLHHFTIIACMICFHKALFYIYICFFFMFECLRYIQVLSTFEFNVTDSKCQGYGHQQNILIFVNR